nr:hypothetical protein Q903MT_gene1378 [Picea sitchensis]
MRNKVKPNPLGDREGTTPGWLPIVNLDKSVSLYTDENILLMGLTAQHSRDGRPLGPPLMK